jgi:hypothetical protein
MIYVLKTLIRAYCVVWHSCGLGLFRGHASPESTVKLASSYGLANTLLSKTVMLEAVLCMS